MSVAITSTARAEFNDDPSLSDLFDALSVMVDQGVPLDAKVSVTMASKDQRGDRTFIRAVNVSWRGGRT